MEKLKTISLAVLSLLSLTCNGYIQVLHPQELKDKLGNDGIIVSSLGNFGHITYGASILGRLHYPKGNRYGCNDFTDDDFSNDFLYDEDTDLTPIVIVDRGECTFVTKVRNIEKLGVKTAIIVDDREEYSENLIMADDGTGHSINIPSFMVRKRDGNIIKDVVINNPSKKVYLKAELEINHPDNRVEYELWYSSILDLDYMQLREMALYQFALGKDALFTPRILTYSCLECTAELKAKQCVANGQYCPYLPKVRQGQQQTNVGEVALLEESLRQRCVYEVLNQEREVNSNYTQWFNYALNFIDTCVEEDRFNEDCSKEVMDTVGINSNKVLECVKDSFTNPRSYKDSSDNKILKEDRKWANQIGIILHPQVSINNITYRGDINGYDVFRAVCAGFKDQPKVCRGDNVFDVIEGQDSLLIVSTRRHLAKVVHIIGAVVIVLALNFLALCLYRRYAKKKMNEELAVQVNSAVSQYFKLSGQDSRDF